MHACHFYHKKYTKKLFFPTTTNIYVRNNIINQAFCVIFATNKKLNDTTKII